MWWIFFVCHIYKLVRLSHRFWEILCSNIIISILTTLSCINWKKLCMHVLLFWSETFCCLLLSALLSQPTVRVVTLWFAFCFTRLVTGSFRSTQLVVVVFIHSCQFFQNKKKRYRPHPLICLHIKHLNFWTNNKTVQCCFFFLINHWGKHEWQLGERINNDKKSEEFHKMGVHKPEKPRKPGASQQNCETVVKKLQMVVVAN